MRFSRPPPAPEAPQADWSRYYASAGWGLVHVPKGKKGPQYTAWQKTPISDPQAAARHWSRHPTDGIGVVLGPSGLCSLDVDDMDRARQALSAVEIDLDSLLDDSSNPRVEGNPEKARLLYLAPADGMLPTRKLALPGPNGRSAVILELRAGPVQDLLPPSWHPSGKPYRWLRAPWEVELVPEPPAVLLNLWQRWGEMLPLLQAAIAPDNGQSRVEQVAREYHAQQGQGEAAWDEVRRQIRETLPLADLLARMGSQERGRGRYCCPFHQEENPSFWLHGDIWVCAHGGAPVGFTSSKTGHSVGDVVDLFQYRKGLDSPGNATVELARELRIELPNSSFLASKLALDNRKSKPPKGAGLSGELSSAPIRGQEQKTTRWTRQTVAALRATYQPVAWLLEAILPSGSLGLFAGPPGIGKTWLMLSIALAIATGKHWLGRFQVRQGRVLLVLEEDDPNSILERWDKLCEGQGLSREARDGLPVEFLIQQGVTLVADTGGLHLELLRHVEEFKPDLLVLDPARRLHQLDENDSGQMSILFSLLRQGLAVRGCSVLVVHHLRKRQDFDEGLDRLRGSSDIAASVDSVLEVGGQFGNLLVKHGKSKRGPALGIFLVHADIGEQAIRLSFLNPDTKAEADRQAIRDWLLEALRQGRAMNQSELCKAGKPKGFGRDRIRRTCDEMVEEGQIRAVPGKHNSTHYSLADQFSEGGAGAENNNSGHLEAGGEV